MPAAYSRNIKLSPEQIARSREDNKLSGLVFVSSIPIIGIAFFVDSLVGCCALFLTLANMTLLPLHIMECREVGAVWWKKFPIAVFILNAIVIVIFTGVSYYLHLERQKITYSEARLETFVTAKMALSCNERNCPKVSTSDGVVWSYFYATSANGKPCDRIIVRGKWHDCPSGSKEVVRAEWQKLNVGDVLKVVELK